MGAINVAQNIKKFLPQLTIKAKIQMNSNRGPPLAQFGKWFTPGFGSVPKKTIYKWHAKKKKGSGKGIIFAINVPDFRQNISPFFRLTVGKLIRDNWHTGHPVVQFYLVHPASKQGAKTG